MKKIFLLGDESINKELKALFPRDWQIAGKLDNSAELIIDSSNFPRKKKFEHIKIIDENCGNSIPVLTSSICITASQQCSYSIFPGRLVGIGLYDTFTASKLLELAPTKITDQAIIKSASEFLTKIKLNFTVVPDRTGLVFPRILAMIINEAAQVYSENTASREDIDTAMKLGTNYPFGPLEWADKIGIDLVYNILLSMQRDFGEDRYRPHPLLKEMVNLNQLGVKTKKGFYEY